MTLLTTLQQADYAHVEAPVAGRRATRLDRVAVMLSAAERGTPRYERLKVIAYVFAYGGSIRSASRALKRAASY